MERAQLSRLACLHQSEQLSRQNNPGYDDCSAILSVKSPRPGLQSATKTHPKAVGSAGSSRDISARVTKRRLTKPRATGGHFVGRSRSPTGGRTGSRRRGHSTINRSNSWSGRSRPSQLQPDPACAPDCATCRLGHQSRRRRTRNPKRPPVGRSFRSRCRLAKISPTQARNGRSNGKRVFLDSLASLCCCVPRLPAFRSAV